MKKSKYDELAVIRDLERKKIKVNKIRKEIDVTRGENVGIGTLGKVDFLMNHKGYSVLY